MKTPLCDERHYLFMTVYVNMKSPLLLSLPFAAFICLQRYDEVPFLHPDTLSPLHPNHFSLHPSLTAQPVKPWQTFVSLFFFSSVSYYGFDGYALITASGH